MSYNGSGTFVINSAGTPYVSGTVISSTAANALNNDLATGLTTAITKDGQTTPTANIPLGGFKITNLGAGTVASDAARLSQVQNSTTTTLISITGTDTITGTVSPTLTAYATGQVFSFVVAATNTGAVTLNVDSIGVKAVTRTGAVALVAGDMVTGQVAIVEYDGTRFQLINGNSFTNLKVSGTLGVTGATTLSSTLAVTGVTTIAAGTALLPALTTTGDTNTGFWFPAADTIAASTGGTERIRITSGGLFGIACTPTRQLSVQYPFAKTDTASREIAVFKSNDASNANEMLISSTGAATQASRVWNIQTGEDGVSNAGIIVLQPSGGSVTVGATAAGNLFISKQTTSLSVQGAYFEAAGSDGSPSYLRFIKTFSGSRNAILNFYNGSYVGGMDFTNTTTSFPTSSDERLKTDLGIVSSTDVIEKLIIHNFEWKIDGSKAYGVFAQEAYAVKPDAITVGSDEINEDGNLKQPWSVDYSKFVPDLIVYSQQLKAIIDTQSARITALETL